MDWLCVAVIIRWFISNDVQNANEGHVLSSVIDNCSRASMQLSALKILIFILIVDVNLVSAETFTVVSDYWCPYNCEPSADPEGFGIDLLRQAFEAKGIKVNYILRPWDQALAMVESNQYHAVMSANKTDSRLLLYPESYFSRSTTCFFTSNDHAWEYNGVKSIDKIRLGVIEGYSYGSLLDAYLDAHRDTITWVSGRNPLEQLIDKIKTGDIDVIIEDENVFEHQAAVHKEWLSMRTGYCLPPANIYMAFAPGHPDTKRYMKIYDDRMKVFLKGDIYKKIMNRYK